MNTEPIEVVTQIAAETTCLDLLSEDRRLVEARIRTLTLTGVVEPTAKTCFSSSTRNSSGCRLQRHIADLVEKDRATTRSLKKVLLGADSPGKGTFDIGQKADSQVNCPALQRNSPRRKTLSFARLLA